MTETRRRQLYGRRKGPKLRAHQADLIETLLPVLRIALPGEGTIDPANLFPDPVDAIAIEIGFGGGEHLLDRAARFPATGFLGCEPFVNGIAKLLAGIEAGGLRNIRIHDGDARDLLACLASGSVNEVHLLFPDPWPKTRHHKRRFVSPDTLSLIHRALKPAGLFRFASDIPHYVAWTLFEVRQHGGFEWTAECPTDWRDPPDGWPGTRYEAKARREGRAPAWLDFRRRAD